MKNRCIIVVSSSSFADVILIYFFSPSFMAALLWCISNWLSTHRIFPIVSRHSSPSRIDVSFTCLNQVVLSLNFKQSFGFVYFIFRLVFFGKRRLTSYSFFYLNVIDCILLNIFSSSFIFLFIFSVEMWVWFVWFFHQISIQLELRARFFLANLPSLSTK